MTEQVLICIGCPLGCRVTLKISDDGKIESMIGNQCKEGKGYVIAEFRAPVRVFTATILTEDGKYLLPVKTDKPVFKDDFKKIMKAIANLRVKPPSRWGKKSFIIFWKQGLI